MSRSKAGGEGHIFGLRVDSYLVKEIQRLIGVAGIETLSIKQIEKKVDIERELYKLFHGDFDDNTTDEMDAASLKDSMVVKFFEGRDQFAAATAVEEWIRHDGSKGERRHLVPGLIQNFVCKVNRTVFALDNTFTKASRRLTLSLALLSSKNFHPQKSSGQQQREVPEHLARACISGANLYRLANQAITMCQEAVRMGADFLINGRDLPEGKTRNDYFRYVLIKMYRKYGPYGENSLWPNSPPPICWHFKGWMAFYLLGPMADPAIQCRLFVPSACTIPATIPPPPALEEIPPIVSMDTNRDRATTPDSNAAPSAMERVPAATTNDTICVETMVNTADSHETLAPADLLDLQQLYPSTELQLQAVRQERLAKDRNENGTEAVSVASIPTAKDSYADDYSRDLESLKRLAVQVCDQAALTAFKLEAKLVELQRYQDPCQSSDGQVDNSAIYTKKRNELEMLHQELKAKRQRLNDDYDDVVSRLIHRTLHTSTTTTSNRVSIAAPSRVSVSPPALATNAAPEAHDLEIFSC